MVSAITRVWVQGKLHSVGWFVTTPLVPVEVDGVGIPKVPGMSGPFSPGWRGMPRMLAVLAVVITAVSSPVHAEQLPEERCQALRDELPILEGGGAGENFRKGSEWGKANLSPEQLRYVQRLLTVRENLLFRCRTFDVVRNSRPRSYAPGAAPLPEKRQPPPPGAVVARAGDVPVPVRPSRGADLGVAGDGVDLRGTVPTRSQGHGAVPPPERKAAPGAPGGGTEHR